MRTREVKFDAQKLTEDLKREGKVLGLHSGAVEMIAVKVVAQTESWLKRKAVVTQEDLNKKVGEILSKYNSDLAYVYQNRGKII